MTGSWVSKALGKTQVVDHIDNTHTMPTTLLVLGRNTFGDEIYTYIRLPIHKVEDVKQKLAQGGTFVPSEYGSVVAAGRGKPTPEITEEVGIPEFMLYFKPKQALPGHLTGQQSTQGGY